MAALVLHFFALLFIISGYMGNFLTSFVELDYGFIQCFTADVPQWLFAANVDRFSLCGAGSDYQITLMGELYAFFLTLLP